MSFDMDGNWQGEEPPCCIYCLDVGMDETENGFICPACDFYTEWDEGAGIWHEYPPKVKPEGTAT